jgi:hypothetical protein
MLQTVIFFQVCFAKSKIGHYFCPLFTFPKKSWRKKYTNLYNKWIYLLKEHSKYMVIFLMIISHKTKAKQLWNRNALGIGV